MRTELFAQAVLEASTPADFLGSVIQSSTEYSILAKDLEGNVVLWNEGARRLYGYRPDEIMGKSADILHAPEDIALGLPQRMRHEALRDGRWEGVITRITRDKLRILVRAVLTPRFEPSGTPIGFLLISKDVSNEFRLRERIARTKLIDVNLFGTSADDLLEFLITLLQASTHYSIVGLGIDGRIVLWNEGARQLYGYESGEVVGRANISLLHSEEDKRKGLVDSILACARRDSLWSGKVHRVRKSGDRFVAQVVVTPRFDADRRFVGYLMISHPEEVKA
jgi:PAS domain S-box-containing protein